MSWPTTRVFSLIGGENGLLRLCVAQRSINVVGLRCG